MNMDRVCNHVYCGRGNCIFTDDDHPSSIQNTAFSPPPPTRSIAPQRIAGPSAISTSYHFHPEGDSNSHRSSEGIKPAVREPSLDRPAPRRDRVDVYLQNWQERLQANGVTHRTPAEQAQDPGRSANVPNARSSSGFDRPARRFYATTDPPRLQNRHPDRPRFAVPMPLSHARGQLPPRAGTGRGPNGGNYPGATPLPYHGHVPAHNLPTPPASASVGGFSSPAPPRREDRAPSPRRGGSSSLLARAQNFFTSQELRDGALRSLTIIEMREMPGERPICVTYAVTTQQLSELASEGDRGLAGAGAMENPTVRQH